MLCKYGYENIQLYSSLSSNLGSSLIVTMGWTLISKDALLLWYEDTDNEGYLS